MDFGQLVLSQHRRCGGDIEKTSAIWPLAAILGVRLCWPKCLTAEKRGSINKTKTLTLILGRGRYK